MQQAGKLNRKRRRSAVQLRQVSHKCVICTEKWTSLSKPLPPTRCPAFSSGCCARSTAVRRSHAAAATPQDLPASQNRHPSASSEATAACTGVYLQRMHADLPMVIRK